MGMTDDMVIRPDTMSTLKASVIRPHPLYFSFGEKRAATDFQTLSQRALLF